MTPKYAVSVVKRGGGMTPAPIDMWMTDTEVGIRMGLADFLDAVVSEVGNPTMLVTQAQLRARLAAAAEVVARRMKVETARLG